MGTSTASVKKIELPLQHKKNHLNQPIISIEKLISTSVCTTNSIGGHLQTNE
jgi:hypothetical protein